MSEWMRAQWNRTDNRGAILLGTRTDQGPQTAVRIATIKAIATLPVACISHDPRIEPDLIRTQPKKRAHKHERQNGPHIGHDQQNQQVRKKKDERLQNVGPDDRESARETAGDQAAKQQFFSESSLHTPIEERHRDRGHAETEPDERALG